VNNNVGGNLLLALKALYKNVKTQVRSNNTLSDVIECTMGVRQGCNLSPILFCLYINELYEYLKSKNIRGIQLTPDYVEIFMLLFADDVALASDTVSGLQQQLNHLHELCVVSKLNVNVDKTKIVVFKNGGRPALNEKWYYNNALLECVQGFNYVGVHFSSSLSMFKMAENMSCKAKRVIISMLSSLYDYMPMPYHCYFKIVDAKVMPILLYGSELWGLKSFEVVERVHTYACKRFMSAPIYSCNNAIIGDCGRYPIHIYSSMRVVKYWLRLLETPYSRHTKKCYEMLKCFNDIGYVNWVTSLRNHLQSIGFGYVWEQQAVANKPLFLINYAQRLKDIFVQQWIEACNSSSKLKTYNGFKSNFEFESYLNILTIRKFRNAYVCFRISSHKLMIEQGRYLNIDRDQRLCPFCKNDIENEFHFLLICTTYLDLRKMYIPIKYYTPATTNKFNKIMSSREEKLIRSIAMFLYYAFERRNALLNSN